MLRRYTDLEAGDADRLLHLSGGFAVSELAVGAGDWMAERTLGELGLREEGVAVLGISRTGGRYLGAPVGSTRVFSGGPGTSGPPQSSSGPG